MASRYGSRPLHFERNVGQAAAPIQFIAHSSDYTVALTSGEAHIVLPGQKGRHATNRSLRMKPAGMNPHPAVVAEEPLVGTVNYIFGNDSKKWRTGVPTFGKVRLKQVYSGIDLVYYGNQQQLEYDFIVQPGADPKRVALDFEGAQGIHLASNGDLLLLADDRELRWKKPIAYQMANGKRELVAAHYTLTRTANGTAHVGMAVASYDHTRTLVLDPTLFLRYNMSIAGNGNDQANGIAVDSAGNSYTIGTTTSTNLSPTTTLGASGGEYVFVNKRAANGDSVYLTLIGGDNNDEGNGIAIDSAGNAYLTGVTRSTNFPTNTSITNNVPNGTVKQGTVDVFIAKLNATGTGLLYSTYLGSGSNDTGYAIVVDSAGTAYVTGVAGPTIPNRAAFPTTTTGYQTTFGGAFSDAFLSKLTFDGTTLALAYSTFLGGNGSDMGAGIDVEASTGIAYVVGNTESTSGFPLKNNAFQPTNNGTQDGFLVKINTTLSGNASLLYGTYFGGADSDNFRSVIVKGSGIVDIAGDSNSTNFPVTGSAYKSTTNNSASTFTGDAVLVELDTTISGSSGLRYSTYFGGTEDDTATGIALDGSNNVYITGSTRSGSSFPVSSAVQSSNAGGRDAFVAEFDLTKSGTAALIYSTFVGTTRNEFGTAIAVDGSDNAYVTGYRDNLNADGSTNSSFTFDGFIFKLGVNHAPVANAQSVTTAQNTAVSITLTGSDTDGNNLTYSVQTSPAHGTLSGTAPNLTYAPNAGFFGTDSFTFRVNDGTENSNTATVSITVVGKPTANNQAVNVAHNTAQVITLTGSDPNSPPRSLTYTITANPMHGTLSGTAPNVTYTPTAGYHGNDTFIFTVNNGVSTSTAGTVALNVAVGTPTANAQSVSTNQNTAKAITLTGSDDDVPALALTYAIATNPAHGTLSGFNAATGAVTYTPTAGYSGADSFTFTVSNGTNTSTAATVSITVNQVISAPTANPQTVAVAHNTSKPITLTGSDTNTPARTLTYAIATNPSHGTLSGFNAATGAVNYTPAVGYHGADSFTFTVNNGTFTSSPATVTLNVATGVPTANAQSVSTNQNTPVNLTLTGSDDDVPALSLTYTVTTSPAHGTLSGTAPNLTYTPTNGYSGADSFQFTVSNGTNTSTAATVSITVNQAISAPTANSQSVSTNQDTAVGITLTGSDPNAPPRTLTYTITTSPSHGTLSGTAPNVTYTPTAGYFGPDTFQFKVNNGAKDSNIATVSISVIQVIGAPTANSQSVSTNQDTAVGITLTGSDSNTPPRSLTYSVTTGPTHGTLSGTAPNLTYTPNAGYFGPDTFQFKVNNGAKDSNIATVSITVNQVQVISAPTANPQSVATNQNTAVGITLTGSDSNSPPRSLTYSVVTGPTNGTLSGTAPNLTYTPNAGYSGSDSFTFKVNNGSKDSNIATISITVNPTVIDVSGQIQVTRGAFVYNRAQGTYSQQVTLTNTGNTDVTGPISLILSGLTNGTLNNATGTTSSILPAGRPYINTGSLAAGASVTLTLQFTKTGASAITYSTQVVAGPGPR